MSNPTSSETTFNDEELIARLRVGVPTVWEKQAADRIEALVKERDAMGNLWAQEKVRADRAEAALAAQIEADAGICGKHSYSNNQYVSMRMIDAAREIRAQPHDRTALDRMLAEHEVRLREARNKALSEAADMFDADSNIAQTIRALINSEQPKENMQK